MAMRPLGALLICLLAHLAGAWGQDQSDQITLHDTHPLISYSPDVSCVPLPFHWWDSCPQKHNPWALKDYKDGNTGLNSSYHVVSNRRNGAKGEGAREISFVLQGSSVAIYGAPPNLVGPPTSQEICINQQECKTLDVESAYRDAKDMNDPVLIWSGDMPTLNSSQAHQIVIRMLGSSSLEDEPEKFMTLDRVIYKPYTEFDPPRPHPLPAGSSLKNVSIEDTSHRISYYGFKKCTSWWWWRLLAGCSTMSDPWEKKLFQVETGATFGRHRTVTETFHQATTMFEVGEQGPQTQAIFNFKGSAVCIFGAPRSQITYPHGAQEVDLDGWRHYIDAHQLYLNIPSSTSPPTVSPTQLSNKTSMDSNEISQSSAHPEKQPVLLWCMEGLDHTKKHRLVYKLVEPNPRYGSGDGSVRKGMTISYITYSRVVRPRSPHTHQRIMMSLFAFTSFLSLCVFLTKRRSPRTTSVRFVIDPNPNFTVDFYNGRFRSEHDHLVSNNIRSPPCHYSRIYRYGAPASPDHTGQGQGANERGQYTRAGSSTIRADIIAHHSISVNRQWRAEPSNAGNSSGCVAPVPKSKTPQDSVLRHPESESRWGDEGERPPPSQLPLHGNHANRHRLGASATPTSTHDPIRATDASRDVPPPYTPLPVFQQ